MTNLTLPIPMLFPSLSRNTLACLALAACSLNLSPAADAAAVKPPSSAVSPASIYDGYTIPIVDLDGRDDLHVVVDKEKGQYLGHPTTLLLKDGRSIICVYPKGHGAGPIVMKMSHDGGKTWGERLPVPESWKTSKEVPTLYQTVDAAGKERLLLFSGTQGGTMNNKMRNRFAISENEGKTWSELMPVPQQPGGIVAMSDMIPLKTGKGHYMASYHVNATGEDAQGKFHTLTLCVVFTEDGGVTWSAPRVVFPGKRDLHLCEAGIVRSPDGKSIALLLRENSRNHGSQIMISKDEGKTWSEPKELPAALAGDRHQSITLPDGRLLIQFRDAGPGKKPGFFESPTAGDWVGWVGTWDDLVNRREGQYRIRLKDNRNGWDTAYPAAELLPDGTLVCTTYGHFDRGESPYILSTRFRIQETDRLAKKLKTGLRPEIRNDFGKGDILFDPNKPEEINALIRAGK